MKHHFSFCHLIPDYREFYYWCECWEHTAPVTSSARYLWSLDLILTFLNNLPLRSVSWRLPPIIMSNWLHTWLLNTNRLTQGWALSVWVFQGIFIVSLMEAVCDGARKWLAPPLSLLCPHKAAPGFYPGCIEQSVGSSRPGLRPWSGTASSFLSSLFSPPLLSSSLLPGLFSVVSWQVSMWGPGAVVTGPRMAPDSLMSAPTQHHRPDPRWARDCLLSLSASTVCWALSPQPSLNAAAPPLVKVNIELASWLKKN